MIKEIGGFFEINFGENERPYHKAIKLNSGRNALKYIIMASQPEKIYLPYYICNSILEIIAEKKIRYEFYHIDENLDPVFDKILKPDEMFLYVNYFGIKDRIVKILSKKFKNLIVDNTQSFFSKPIRDADTFYSPRKFFGVADGGYLYTTKKIKEDIEQDESYKRYEHLLKRLDVNAEESRKLYLTNEDALRNQPVRVMSKLTGVILENLDYRKARIKRRNNFLYLHSLLSRINKLSIDVKEMNTPMTYPFLIFKKNLKKFLIYNKIYVPTYWEEVCKRVNDSSIEYKLTKYLLPLPIDQRYGVEDMKRIYSIISEFKE